MITSRRLLIAIFLILLTGAAAAQSAEAPLVRTVAVVWEQDHPQVLLLAQSLKAELVNLGSVELVDDPEAGDALLYVGRLELGSRDSLWARGVDRYFDDEVFTETLIFQQFDTDRLLDEFLPRIIRAVEDGFPPLDADVAGIVADQRKGEVAFPDPDAAGPQPVTLTLEAPEGTRMMLDSGAVSADSAGMIVLRALPGTLLRYRVEAPGHVPENGELTVGSTDETRSLSMEPYARWALELKGRMPEFGVLPGVVRYLLDEEIFAYASLEQNILSLKNLFTFGSDSSPGFIQPVIGLGGYQGEADALFRPYMGFGLVTRFVFGESRTVYLSKTMTAGIDFSLGLDIDPFKNDDLSLIVNYTPRIFYSSFYERPMSDYISGDNLPLHIEGNWHLQWAGPFNIGVRWEL